MRDGREACARGDVCPRIAGEGLPELACGELHVYATGRTR